MADKIEGKKMTETEKKFFEIVELKQPQAILDLDNPDSEDSKITVITKKISWKKDEKGNEPPTAEKLKILRTLVHPEEKIVDALEKFFSSESYQESKEKALAAGNYLTSQIRSGITAYLSNKPAFENDSAKTIFKRWMDGYKSKDAKIHGNAVKVLETVKAALQVEDLGF
jgi:hypothetical protein